MAPAPNIPPLPLHRIRVNAQRRAATQLGYLGSTVRGALGESLRPLACTTRLTDCTPCPQRASCPLPVLFDNPVPPDTSDAGLLAGYRNAPQPFVINVPFGVDSTLPAHTFELTLIGAATAHADIAEKALIAALEHKLPAALRYQVQAVDHPDTPTMPPTPSATMVELQTPVQIRADGQRLNAHTFHPTPWITSILRRHSLLRRFYTPDPLELDFAGLKAAASRLHFSRIELHDHQNRRHSNRRDTDMPMHGLHGRFRLEGDALAELWPWLWHGQWLHAGRWTTMGFGRYRLESASLPNTAKPRLTGHNTLRLKR